MEIISPEHEQVKFPGTISFLEEILHPELVNKYQGFVHVRKNAISHGFLSKETKDVPFRLDREPVFNSNVYSIPTTRILSYFSQLYEDVLLPLSAQYNFLFTKIFLHSHENFPVLHSLDAKNSLVTEAYTMLTRNEYATKSTSQYKKK